MTTLIQPQRNLTAEQIELAEASVSAFLGMMKLTEYEVQQKGRLGVSGIIRTVAPISTVVSLHLDGVPVVDPTVLGRFSITHQVGYQPKYGDPWGSGPMLPLFDLRYTAGWPDEASAPNAIKFAVLDQAQRGGELADRAGIASESMGPVSRSYTQSNEILSKSALALLKGWRPC